LSVKGEIGKTRGGGCQLFRCKGRRKGKGGWGGITTKPAIMLAQLQRESHLLSRGSPQARHLSSETLSSKHQEKGKSSWARLTKGQSKLMPPGLSRGKRWSDGSVCKREGVCKSLIRLGVQHARNAKLVQLKTGGKGNSREKTACLISLLSFPPELQGLEGLAQDLRGKGAPSVHFKSYSSIREGHGK